LNETVATGSPPDLPIRRNTVILSATMAVNSAVLQLTAAVSSLTFVLVTGVRDASVWARRSSSRPGLTAVAVGRLMDAGRTPVMTMRLRRRLQLLTALATHTDSTITVTASAPRRRVERISLSSAHGRGDILSARAPSANSYVLFGSVFGAIL
jgi:siroheme synthase